MKIIQCKKYLILASIVLLMSCSDDSTDASTFNLSEEIIEDLVDQHNFYRSDVGVDNINWSYELAGSSLKWAKTLSKNCELVHSTSGNGENLWKGTAGAFTPLDVVDSWGSEKAYYNYSDNSCAENEDCGHYTQVVWENTTHVGCAIAICDGFEIWVCQYDPPGNFIGEKPY